MPRRWRRQAITQVGRQIVNDEVVRQRAAARPLLGLTGRHAAVAFLGQSGRASLAARRALVVLLNGAPVAIAKTEFDRYRTAAVITVLVAVVSLAVVVLATLLGQGAKRRERKHQSNSQRRQRGLFTSFHSDSPPQICQDDSRSIPARRRTALTPREAGPARRTPCPFPAAPQQGEPRSVRLARRGRRPPDCAPVRSDSRHRSSSPRP